MKVPTIALIIGQTALGAWACSSNLVVVAAVITAGCICAAIAARA